MPVENAGSSLHLTGTIRVFWKVERPVRDSLHLFSRKSPVLLIIVRLHLVVLIIALRRFATTNLGQ